MHVPAGLFTARQLKNTGGHFPIIIFCDIIVHMKRGIWFWLYFVVAIILAVYFATRITMTYMNRGQIAHVRGITISADGANKDLTPIATAAAVAPGTNAFRTDLAQINTRIASVPGVRNSAVRRMPNGNLAVTVELYRAVAQWTDGTHFFPLSADGTIVNRPTDMRAENTVVFRGELPNDISAITNAAQSISAHLDYLEWVEGRRWNIHTTGGITVMLPEKSPDAAIAGLMVLDKNHGILSKQIELIDMRDDARILVK